MEKQHKLNIVIKLIGLVLLSVIVVYLMMGSNPTDSTQVINKYLHTLYNTQTQGELEEMSTQGIPIEDYILDELKESRKEYLKELNKAQEEKHIETRAETNTYRSQYNSEQSELYITDVMVYTNGKQTQKARVKLWFNGAKATTYAIEVV